ncbi:hypothetical protein EZS27_015956 [termite gut metagenome]|uniref:Vitellogenin II n=1 Tax=termite gut metagenome TaxID=433724 RepID=A0A5J4RPI2_9ZZZZ
MKKIVLSLLFALCFPILSAQNYNDDLYYIPEKNKETGKNFTKKEVKTTTTTTIYTTPQTTVVIRDSKTKKIRDVDEYNRRYDSSSYHFEPNGDTLYIEEKNATDLDGEWINGFNGSQDDYEYAERIIRFRNPRYAVHISSPLYWDVVYGLNSWDWNVYTDGWYAYAFPAFPNRLWWDWRFNSFGLGWGSYYSWNYVGYWGGYYHPYHSYYYPHYYGGGWHHDHNSGYGARNVYHNDRRSAYSSNRTNAGSSASSRRSTTYNNSNVRKIENGISTRDQNYTPSTQSRRSSSSTRVVGTRDNAGNERQGVTTRSNNSSSRTTTYTRPSTTRNTDASESKTNESTYTPGSSTTSSSRRSSNESSSSSYGNNTSNSSSSRQSSYSSSGSSSRSSSSSNSSSSSSGSRGSSSGSSSGSGGRRR